jgi:hypothetical protein
MGIVTLIINILLDGFSQKESAKQGQGTSILITEKVVDDKILGWKE